VSNKLLEVVDATKRYGNKTILSSLNFAINEQMALAIIGANGSGKSTLLRMLAGISSMTSGTIRYSERQSRLAPGGIGERFPEYLSFVVWLLPPADKMMFGLTNFDDLSVAKSFLYLGYPFLYLVPYGYLAIRIMNRNRD
jgi:energy-coupling factor transporter ATP-binding protein EcfA2